MSVHAATIRRTLCVSVKDVHVEPNSTIFVSRMSKRYQVLKRRLPRTGGGFVEAFVMGIAEYSCLGEQNFDLSGYPYESEIDAFAEDWKTLSKDAYAAADKLKRSKE